MASSGCCSQAVRRYAVKVVDAMTIGSIGPVGCRARNVARGCFKPPPVEIDDVSALAWVIGQDSPGKRMIALADPKAAKRHHGIGHLTRVLLALLGFFLINRFKLRSRRPSNSASEPKSVDHSSFASSRRAGVPDRQR